MPLSAATEGAGHIFVPHHPSWPVGLCLEVIIIELSAYNFNYENQIVQLYRRPCDFH